ncbi:hypothetical protein [Mesorhizobium sp.]|uniref:hypothetical protein n=1 Tax=Mesorhizobium sp. TaxID=1871066 RepID=UPI00120D246E|nr:hypothetical protein [Mesorhizobium sp.]TIM05503.1 MAG: hypothetical protein E5Y62_27315 [Mesorhizobium sp.]
MAKRDLHHVVWGETRGLEPRDGSDGTLARLHAVVGQLAQRAQDHGIDDRLKSAEPPRVGDAQEQAYRKLADTVSRVEAGTWTGEPLPQRAALWEVTPTGAPRFNNDSPLPNPVAWLLDADVRRGSEFAAGQGTEQRIYRLFESDKIPAAEELPYVSDYTKSGLPAEEGRNPYLRLAWWIGIVSAILFVAACIFSVWSGRAVGSARDMLGTNEAALQQALLVKVAEICQRDKETYPQLPLPALCSSLAPLEELGKDPVRFSFPASANVPAALAEVKACAYGAAPTASTEGARPDQTTEQARAQPGLTGCDTIIWRAALALEAERNWLTPLFGYLYGFSDWLTGVSATAEAASVVAPFMMMVIGIAGLTIALGLGTKRRVAGIWIDDRNRVSLARAQVTLWTIVALAGYSAFVTFNIGLAGLVTRDLLGLADVARESQVFPQIPTAVAAALGIALVSPMLSALILDTKTGITVAGEYDMKNRGGAFFGNSTSGLDTRSSPTLASITDIFMGEEHANSETVDLSRLQNVVITVILVLGYASLLIEMMREIAPATILGVLNDKHVLFTSLPNPGGTFASLLFVSHATYLVSKAYDNKWKDANPVEAKANQ